MKLGPKIISLLLYLVILTLGWGSNVVYRELQSPLDQNLALFNTTWSIINNEYLDQASLDSKKMMYGAIKGMVASIGDPFTTFLNPSEHSAFQASLTGIFEGAGIEISSSDEKIVIESVFDKSAGHKMGLKKGDIIISINNKASELWSISEINKIINGKKGVVVNMEVLSPSELSRRALEITQDQYIPPSIKYKLDISGRQIGIIEVTRFGDQTIEEWKKIVSDIDMNKPDGLVLDLRNNLGGFAEVPLFIASEFIRSGEIYKVIDAQGYETIFTVNHEGRLLDIPVVVLINRKSVSATEMLAGSLKYHNRAVLIGEKSFGKGTEQVIIDLPDGSGLHVTTTKWFLPDGSSVDKSGLVPEYQIALTKDDFINNRDPQLAYAVQILNQQ